VICFVWDKLHAFWLCLSVGSICKFQQEVINNNCNDMFMVWLQSIGIMMIFCGGGGGCSDVIMMCISKHKSGGCFCSRYNMLTRYGYHLWASLKIFLPVLDDEDRVDIVGGSFIPT
jgi:hypothetical protein